MSTLVAQTISNGSVSTSSANVIQGSAKAWAQFNISTSTKNSSYNISSFTKNGTGDVTINFTTAMSDANYVVSGQASSVGVAAGYLTLATSAPTTTALRFAAISSAGTFFDATNASIAIFGN